jgi:hypothetical protein
MCSLWSTNCVFISQKTAFFLHVLLMFSQRRQCSFRLLARVHIIISREERVVDIVVYRTRRIFVKSWRVLHNRTVMPIAQGHCTITKPDALLVMRFNSRSPHEALKPLSIGRWGVRPTMHSILKWHSISWALSNALGGAFCGWINAAANSKTRFNDMLIAQMRTK